jgi:tetratricopeptide (TPR) repeat protein
VNRIDERDAQQETHAEPDVHVAPHDLTIGDRSSAGAEEPHAGQPLARTMASDRLAVGNIPAQRPGFQPRPALVAPLTPASEGTPAVQVLIGTPGVGKTQLAAAYARARLAAGWRLVAWIDAENARSLEAGLAAVANAARLSNGSSWQSTADVGQAVRHWLEADGERCLLVFDEAEDPDVLRPFVPTSGAAQVLITAAQESVADLGTRVRVDAFSAEEAAALLDGRTGLGDEAGAAQLAAELGFLPLPLDHAAAVIARQQMGYGAYLGRLRTMPVEEYLVHGTKERYPGGTAAAVLLSLEAILAADRTRPDARVLEVIAMLSAGGVRRELLRAAGDAGALGGGAHQVSAEWVDQALAQLAEQALLTFTVDGQSVIMHRLVAQVVREVAARRGHLAAVLLTAARALEAYAEALAVRREHTAVRDIPIQVTTLLENAGPAGEADEELARIFLRLRFFALYHLIELGDSMPEAIAVGEPLTADLERLLGPDHLDTLNARNSLAAAYQATGRAAEAIPLFEQTLVGRVRLLGPDHPDTLTSQHNLAATYDAAGRAVEAIFLFRLTLAARERLLGADHPSTLNSRANLAAVYRHTGRITEAIPFLEQTLAGRERLLGPDHPDTLRSRNNLAGAYRAAGRAAEAIPLVEHVVTSRERTLGPDHPKTLASRNNLALAYREAGRTAEAIPLLEQTLATCERLLGTDDPRTQAARRSLLLASQDADRPQ